MSRQRKTWVSDAYAKRQAAFMQLPPAKINRPLRRIIKHFASAVFGRHAGAEVKGMDPEQRMIYLRQLTDVFIKAAKRGQGKVLQAFAYKHFA